MVMLQASYLPGLLTAMSGFFALLCLTRLKHRRLLAAGRAGVSCAVTGALALAAIALGLNLYTYHRLSFEQPLATLDFQQLGPQHFRVLLAQPNQPIRALQLTGDEWQLDARVLKWRPAANLLGFDALARLDRLSGRYQDIEQPDQQGSAIDLRPSTTGWDAWRIARRLPAPLVDARYGSAVFLPMADGARYRVTLSQSGLVARPDNDAAQQAIRRW